MGKWLAGGEYRTGPITESPLMGVVNCSEGGGYTVLKEDYSMERAFWEQRELYKAPTNKKIREKNHLVRMKGNSHFIKRPGKIKTILQIEDVSKERRTTGKGGENVLGRALLKSKQP